MTSNLGKSYFSFLIVDSGTSSSNVLALHTAINPSLLLSLPVASVPLLVLHPPPSTTPTTFLLDLKETLKFLSFGNNSVDARCLEDEEPDRESANCTSAIPIAIASTSLQARTHTQQPTKPDSRKTQEPNTPKPLNFESQRTASHHFFSRFCCSAFSFTHACKHFETPRKKGKRYQSCRPTQQHKTHHHHHYEFCEYLPTPPKKIIPDSEARFRDMDSRATDLEISPAQNMRKNHKIVIAPQGNGSRRERERAREREKRDRKRGWEQQQ